MIVRIGIVEIVTGLKLDRINGNIGYTKKNCVTSCSKCNALKWDRTVKEYLNHCVKVLKHNNLI